MDGGPMQTYVEDLGEGIGLEEDFDEDLEETGPASVDQALRQVLKCHSFGIPMEVIFNEDTCSYFTVGELRSILCTKTPLYVSSGSYIKQMLLEHLTYTKGAVCNTLGRT